MATAQWIKEAEEQARKYSDAIKNNNQYLIDQLNNAKTNSLQQLQNQQENALYNLNTNKGTINQNTEEAAKQANINRLLALKDNQYAMNRAGLGTQGIVGSQVNSINNSYGTNLSSIINQRNSQLNDLEKQRVNLVDTYNNNRLNLENEYNNNIANLQSSIDDKALNEYNTIYNKYLAIKQQEYENEQAEKAAAEAIRQYNEKMAYQQARDAVADSQWEKQYSLAKKSSSGVENTKKAPISDGTDIDNSTNTIGVNPYTKTINEDIKNGVFSNGYQPDNINGVKLSKSGKTVSQMLGTSGNVGRSGINIDSQNVWMVNGKYYVWDGSQNKYIDITNEIPKNNNVKKTSTNNTILQNQMNSLNRNYVW